ncbi:MAG: hypothetical protein AAF889_04740 [Cyanobacteria bacterium P01_D01_bin.73]
MPRRRTKSPKPRPCDRCAAPSLVRYRVQYDDSQQWRLVCPACQQDCSRDNPLYRYGGTWKAR